MSRVKYEPKAKRWPTCLNLFFATLFLTAFLGCTENAQPTRPNILLIVADDLNFDSLGYSGFGVAPDISPHIDVLRQQSFSFEKAFSTVSVCQPSRQSMLSGLLPHHYGSVGFFPIKDKVATLPTLLAEAGYLTANIHKIHHMLPEERFPWDYDNEGLGLYEADGYVGRDPEAFAKGLRKLIQLAEDQEVPFLLVANSADPHRPFYGDPIVNDNWFFGFEKVAERKPSRVYSADEVRVPPTLPDLPGIREDLARYASSVRRLDDTVGACLEVLEDTGKVDSTIVIFVSDNGMPLPFAKFDTYLGSNLSPFLIRLPQTSTAGGFDDRHLVSLMDVTPTLLELVGIAVPEGLDGQSLMPLIEGKKTKDWRDEMVFIRYQDIYYKTGYEKRAARDTGFMSKLEELGWRPRPDHPSEGTLSRDRQQRCYFDGRYGYIYNDWYRPDGLELGPLGVGVPYSDRTLNSMKELADENTEAAQRVERYLLRAQEELYDWRQDPGSRINLAKDPKFAKQLESYRQKLRGWMQKNKDPLLGSYEAKVYQR